MTKTEAVLRTIASLGVNCGYSDAKAYAQKTFNLKIDDSTFYELRKRARIAAAKKDSENATASTIKAARAVNAKKVKSAAKVTTAPKPFSFSTSSLVLDAVKSAKKLINMLGRDEAKQLIDSL